MKNTITVAGPMRKDIAIDVAKSLGNSNHSIYSLAKDVIDEDGNEYTIYDDGNSWYVEKHLDIQPKNELIFGRTWEEIKRMQKGGK